MFLWFSFISVSSGKIFQINPGKIQSPDSRSDLWKDRQCDAFFAADVFLLVFRSMMLIPCRKNKKSFQSVKCTHCSPCQQECLHLRRRGELNDWPTTAILSPSQPNSRHHLRGGEQKRGAYSLMSHSLHSALRNWNRHVPVVFSKGRGNRGNI